jgi:signal transduction histidine kinase
MIHSGDSFGQIAFDASRYLDEIGASAPTSTLPGRRAGNERCGDIAVVTHELRNSLAVIRNAARLLRKPASSDIVDSARMLIERHAAQMSQHIDDLVDPDSSGVRRHGLRRSHIDLRIVARHAADAISPEMARRGHRMVVELPAEPIWADADGARLEQALSNLLINAAKYTPDGGHVTLVMERDDERVRVRIRDSGVGIEPAMLSRVFGMFVQVGTLLPGRESGRGIGLAVVRAVVEQHGGTVTATSAGLGLGSEFTVALPTMRARGEPLIVLP